MSTFSTNLGLELIGNGEQTGTWGDTTNTNLGTLLEQAISGYVTQAITDGADTVITIPDGASGVARNMSIECTGTLTAARNLVVPAKRKLYFIYNNTSGGYAVTVKVSGQTGVSVPNGKKMILVNNGTDVVVAENYLAALSLGAALPVTSGGTGVTTSTGSGSVVLSTSPSLTTPALGTPASGNFSSGTFTWPTFNQNTTGTAAGLSSTLAVASGGTGVTTTPSNGQLLIGNGTGYTAANLTAGSNVTITNSAGGITIAATTSSGTVTSVTGTSPVASTGGTTPVISLSANYGDTLNPYASKTANYFLAAPNGSAGVPTFRAIAAGDIPTLNQNTTGTAAGLSATLAVASGGTGVTTSTGTGSVVLSNSPTLVTPALGTPASGNFSSGTFTWPTFNQNTTGTAAGLSSTLAVSSGGTGQTTYTDGQLLIGNSTGNTLTKATLTAGANITITNSAGGITIAAAGGGGGSVTGVTATAPIASTGGTAPVISLNSNYGDALNPYASKTANYVLAAPNGSAGAPTFRALVAADIPTLNQNTTGTAGNVTGTVAVANGGTGLTSTPANGALDIGNGTGFTRTTLTAGSNISITNSSGGITIAATGLGTGTVTSVGLALPADFTISGSPVTSTGTLTATYASQTANKFLASPNGSTGTPSYRAIVAADIPTLNQNTTGTAANVTGTVAIANGGTGATTQQAGINALAGSTTSGQYLRGNGTNVTMSAIQAADVPTLNQNTTGNAANVTGTVAIANGGTGATTQQGALNAVAGAVTSGQYLRGNGTNVVLAAIQAADVPTLNQNTTGSANSVITNNIISDTTSYIMMTPNAGSGTAQTPGTFSSLYFNTSTNTITGANIDGTAAGLTSTLAISAGGTGQTTQQAAINSLAGAVTSGTYLRGNGTNVSMSSLQAADITGTVAVNKGGTGVATLTGLAYGNGTSAFTAATGGQIVSAIGASAVANANSASSAAALSTTNFTITESGGKLVFKYGATTIASLDSLGNFSADGVYLNDQTIVADYTIPSTSNAGSFGPITIADGVTVTVSDPSVWTVV
jgi:hypothetical protein